MLHSMNQPRNIRGLGVCASLLQHGSQSYLVYTVMSVMFLRHINASVVLHMNHTKPYAFICGTWLEKRRISYDLRRKVFRVQPGNSASITHTKAVMQGDRFETSASIIATSPPIPIIAIPFDAGGYDSHGKK